MVETVWVEFGLLFAGMILVALIAVTVASIKKKA